MEREAISSSFSHPMASSKSDIFEVISKAIEVAKSEFPEEFMSRRDGIVERIYRAVGKETEDIKKKKNGEVEMEDMKKKKKKKNDEVLRIIGVLSKSDQNDEELLHSLRRLQSMSVSAETLRVSLLGKSVGCLLTEHHSEPVQNLARSLISNWMGLLIATRASDAADFLLPELEVEETEEGEIVVVEDQEGIHVSDFLDDHNANPISITQEPAHKIKKKNFKPTEEIKKQTSDVTLCSKIDVAKRKLHESYGEVQEKKRQRMIKLVDLKDLPQQRHSRNTNNITKATWRTRRC